MEDGKLHCVVKTEQYAALSWKARVGDRTIRPHGNDDRGVDGRRRMVGGHMGDMSRMHTAAIDRAVVMFALRRVVAVELYEQAAKYVYDMKPRTCMHASVQYMPSIQYEA